MASPLRRRRDEYRPSTRGFVEHGEAHPVDTAALQARRRADVESWTTWFAEHRIDAIVEPTVPIVARTRGSGYDAPFSDGDEVSLTHYWNWVGFPAVAIPSGVGARTGLPTSVSLIGPPQSDWDLLAAGCALQAERDTVAV